MDFFPCINTVSFRKGGCVKLLIFVVVLSAALLAGCVTGGQIRSGIHQDMTKQQVVAALGRPDGVRTSGNYEALEYANRLISGWSWDRADYYVILKDGVVTSYGPGQVRQEGPKTLVLVPVR